MATDEQSIIAALVDKRVSQILADWAIMCDKASRAMAAQGRGAFAMDVREPYVSGAPLPYWPRAALREAFPGRLLWQLDQYDPGLFILFLFRVSDDDCVLETVMSPAPHGGPIAVQNVDLKAASSCRDLCQRMLDLRTFTPREELPLPALIILDLLDFQYEVCNGGFIQFFDHKPSRRLDIREALREASDQRVAAIYEEVCSTFPDGMPSRDDATFDRQLEHVRDAESIMDKWSNLERDFYRLVRPFDTGPFDTALWSYWLKVRETVG